MRSHAFPPILQLARLSLAHTAITTLTQVVIMMMMEMVVVMVVLREMSVIFLVTNAIYDVDDGPLPSPHRNNHPGSGGDNCDDEVTVMMIVINSFC